MSELLTEAADLYFDGSGDFTVSAEKYDGTFTIQPSNNIFRVYVGANAEVIYSVEVDDDSANGISAIENPYGLSADDAFCLLVAFNWTNGKNSKAGRHVRKKILDAGGPDIFAHAP